MFSENIIYGQLPNHSFKQLIGQILEFWQNFNCIRLKKMTLRFTIGYQKKKNRNHWVGKMAKGKMSDSMSDLVRFTSIYFDVAENKHSEWYTNKN